MTVVVSVTMGGRTAPSPRFTILLPTSWSAVVPPSPPASTSHDGECRDFQEEGTATCTEGYEAKSRVIAPTTLTRHLDLYTSADTGWQFPNCVTTTVLLCSDSTIARNEKLDAADRTNSTVGVVGCTAALSLPQATIVESLRALARTTALLSGLGAFSFAW